MSINFRLDSNWLRFVTRLVATIMIFYSAIAFKFQGIDEFYTPGIRYYIDGLIFGILCHFGLILISMDWALKYRKLTALLMLPALLVSPLLFFLPELLLTGSWIRAFAPIFSFGFFFFVGALYIQLFRYKNV